MPIQGIPGRVLKKKALVNLEEFSNSTKALYSKKLNGLSFSLLLIFHFKNSYIITYFNRFVKTSRAIFLLK